MAVTTRSTRKKAAPPPAPLVRQVSAAAKMSYVICHAEGHQWKHHEGVVDPLDAEPGMRPPFGQSARGRRSNCTSCACERIRWYVRSGEVVNRYRYTDGYLHKKASEDDFAPSRLDWRKSLVVTLFDDVA